MFSSCRNTEKSSTQILKALSFLILSLSIVSKNSPSQFGLDQSERNHVIWRLFLTFRCIHTHPHLNLSSLPLSFQISIIFSLSIFLLYPCHLIFFRCPSILSASLWTTCNVSGSVRDPYCCLRTLFCHAGRIRNSYSCSAVTKAVWLWRSFPALAEEQQKSQTSATAKTKSYLSKPAKTKTSLSKIYE